MVNRNIIILVVLLLAFPLIPYVLAKWDESHGLVWIFIEIIYYLPVSSFMGEPFFYDTEVGPMPHIFGRIAAAIIYLCIACVVIFLYQSRKKSKKVTNAES